MTCSLRGTAARRRRRLAVAALPVALVLPFAAACSSSDAPDGTAAAPVSLAPGGDQIGPPPAVEHAEDLTQKPIAAAGEGAPPPTLVTQDLVTGDGATATATATVTVHYAGTIWKTGEQFDASWDSGAPATFPLTNTVSGFGQGIAGMKEGGRRLIVIPPDLGYGPMGGQPPVILADDTLVFVVDLIEVGEDPFAGAGSGAGADAGAAGGATATADPATGAGADAGAGSGAGAASTEP